MSTLTTRLPVRRSREDYIQQIHTLEKMLWHTQQILDWLSDEAPTQPVCRRIQSTKTRQAALYQQLLGLEEEYQQRFN